MISHNWLLSQWVAATHVNSPRKIRHGAMYMENIIFLIFLGDILRRSKSSNSSNKMRIPTKSSTTVICEMICGFLIL